MRRKPGSRFSLLKTKVDSNYYIFTITTYSVTVFSFIHMCVCVCPFVCWLFACLGLSFVCEHVCDCVCFFVYMCVTVHVSTVCLFLCVCFCTLVRACLRAFVQV